MNKIKLASQKISSFFVFSAAGLAAYWLLVRPWHQKWGATNQEADASFSGDELIPYAPWRTTHAITIQAPIEMVWSWVVQMGQGRGGFYSYDWLENLFGMNIHNADRILPEYQQLKVGDHSGEYRRFPGDMTEPDKFL